MVGVEGGGIPSHGHDAEDAAFPNTILEHRRNEMIGRLTLVTTFRTSPVCSSNVHSLQPHCMRLESLWPPRWLPLAWTGSSGGGSSGALVFLAPSSSDEGAAGQSLALASGRTHVLFGWARRKLSEYWLKPMNNAGIHVSAISCLWYFPNPPRNGSTSWSTRVSSPGDDDDVVSGDTKPFSGCRSSVSSCTTAIALSPVDASCVCARGGVRARSALATPPPPPPPPPPPSLRRLPPQCVSSPPSADGESPAQVNHSLTHSVGGMQVRRPSLSCGTHDTAPPPACPPVCG